MGIRNRKKELVKILGINFTILAIILFSPSLLLRLYQISRNQFYRLSNKTLDQRAYYPTYENKKFSNELFREFESLKTNYRSFLGWKKEKVKLNHINISGPYNTRKSRGEKINNSAWFFGGSTMWGYGASDLQTIPSHFNSLTNIPVYNFGENSWNSRQSLNQLINAIGDNNNPSFVIFYDGVNEVYSQCRSELKLLPAHSREKEIQNALKPIPIQKRISNFILSPYIAFAKKFSIQFPVFNQDQFKVYNCDINQAKALSIAQNLVFNWYTAYSLSKSKNFEFYAILQPNLYTTKTNSEYFYPRKVKWNSEMEIQYRVVYDLTLKEIDKYCKFDSEFCYSFINGTDWLSGTNNIFIDHCHVNSLGNKVIAERLKSVLKK